MINNNCGFIGSAKYFNGEHWVQLKDYRSGDKVLQYCSNGVGVLVEPTEFKIYRDNETMFQYPVACSNGTLTRGHRLIYRDEPSNPFTKEIRLCMVREGSKYWLPATCEWDMGGNYLDLSEIGENLLCCSKPLTEEFRVKVLSLSLKDRLLFLSKVFTGNMYYSDDLEKLTFVADLLALSNEAHYMQSRKNNIGFVQWYSIGRLNTGVGYSKLFKPEYHWRGISTKRYEMFSEVINKKKYFITVPSGMIMLKFCSHIVVVGDSRGRIIF